MPPFMETPILAYIGHISCKAQEGWIDISWDWDDEVEILRRRQAPVPRRSNWVAPHHFRKQMAGWLDLSSTRNTHTHTCRKKKYISIYLSIYLYLYLYNTIYKYSINFDMLNLQVNRKRTILISKYISHSHWNQLQFRMVPNTSRKPSS